MFKMSAVTLLFLSALLMAKPTTPPGLETMDASKLVAKDQGKKLDLGQVDINAWMELYRLVGVTTGTPITVDEIRIDRDFKDYLVQTVDRESTERKNQEN